MQEMTLIHSSDSGSVPNLIQASRYPYSRLEWRSVYEIKPERYLFFKLLSSLLSQNKIIWFKIKKIFLQNVCVKMFIRERKWIKDLFMLKKDVL